MKLIITALLLVFNMTLLSQSNQFAGDYYRTIGEEGNHFIEYKLNLNQNGTFIFHSYNKNGIASEVN